MAKATAAVAKKDTKSLNSPLALQPPYFQMITEAISALKERAGSSQPAIAKAVEEKHEKDHLPANFKKLLSVQLKKLVKSERLVKVKNSYKIASSEKASAKEKRNIGNSSSPKPSKKKLAKKITSCSASAKKGVVKVKTKRLSQVKTPEGPKKKKTVTDSATEAAKTTTKPLSQVKTPEGLKRKVTKAIGSSKPTKKARK